MANTLSTTKLSRRAALAGGASVVALAGATAVMAAVPYIAKGEDIHDPAIRVAGKWYARRRKADEAEVAAGTVFDTIPDELFDADQADALEAAKESTGYNRLREQADYHWRGVMNGMMSVAFAHAGTPKGIAAKIAVALEMSPHRGEDEEAGVRMLLTTACNDLADMADAS